MRTLGVAPEIFLACSILAACGGGGSSGAVPTGGSSPRPTPTPTPAQVRLYVSDGRTPGTINVFLLPLNTTSAPVTVLAGNNGPAGMAFDGAHRLFVANSLSGSLQVFAPPIVSGAVPAFTLSAAAAVDVKLDSRGSAYALGSTRCGFFCSLDNIQVFSSPITGSSTVSVTFPVMRGSLLRTQGLAFDGSGHLWTNTGFRGTCTMQEYSTPIEPSTTAVLTFNNSCANGYGLAFDSSGNMYSDGINGVDVYDAPFTASTTRAFTINNLSPVYLAFDPSGNLYVADIGGSLHEFSPPFSSKSVPVVALALPGVPETAGIAIGP